jgi:hypothetical protein
MRYGFVETLIIAALGAVTTLVTLTLPLVIHQRAQVSVARTEGITIGAKQGALNCGKPSLKLSDFNSKETQ